MGQRAFFNILRSFLHRLCPGRPRALARAGSALAVLAVLGAPPANAAFLRPSSTKWVTTPGSATLGQPVTFTVQVSLAQPPPAHPGAVAILDLDNGAVLGPVPLGANGLTRITSSKLKLGTNHLVAGYSGDSNDLPSITLNPAILVWTETAAPAPTTTGLVSGGSPSVYGQQVTFTATVTSSTGNLTGSVNFFDGANLLGSAPLTASAISTFSTTSLAVGDHPSITAQYAGDSNHAMSTSTAVDQMVNQAPTTTLTPTSKINNFGVGADILFTATVQAEAPGAGTPSAGTVTFQDTSTTPPTTLGVGSLSGGTASIHYAFQAPGSYPIAAVYSGDANFLGSTGSGLTQTVVQNGPEAAAITSLTDLGPSRSVYGQGVTFSATVAGSGTTTPTGFVTFYDTLGAVTTPIDASPLVNGTASLTTTTGTSFNLSAGNHTITASYSGDGYYSPIPVATFPQAAQTVAKADSATSPVFGPPSTIDLNQGVAFTVILTPVAPAAQLPQAGTVTFYDGVNQLGTVDLILKPHQTTAVLPIASLAAGIHSITASYSGEANFNPSDDAASSPFTLTVNPYGAGSAVAEVHLDSQLALDGHNNPVFGEPLTFDASVASNQADLTTTPTGSVTFMIDGVAPTDSTVSLVNGSATYSPAGLLSVGSHSITVSYGGDTTYSIATSQALAQAVDQADTTITLQSTATPAIVGSSGTITASVLASYPGTGVPTGSVRFYDNNGTTPFYTAGLDPSGTAQLPIAQLALGNHPITATYSGDTNYTSSTSTALSQEVIPGAVATTTTLSYINTNNQGQPPTPIDPIAFTVVVSSPSGTPAGTVTLTEGSTTLLGPSALTGGALQFPSLTLASGPHVLTATFTPDDPAAFASSYATLTLTVAQLTSTAITLSPAKKAFFSPETFTLQAAVSTVPAGGGTPTGTVTFEASGSGIPSLSLGSYPVTNGQATSALINCSTLLLAGQTSNSITVTATFNSTDAFTSSTGATIITVNAPIATTISLLATPPSPSTAGDTITFQATVMPASGSVAPTGTVTFKDDQGNTLGTPQSLNSGSASISTSALQAGGRTITATYVPDVLGFQGISVSIPFTVNAPSGGGGGGGTDADGDYDFGADDDGDGDGPASV